MKSENQPNLKNKNPAWKTKEGKNNFEEWLFSLSLSFLSSVGCPFTVLYLPLTQFSITQSWKIAIVLQRKREREREGCRICRYPLVHFLSTQWAMAGCNCCIRHCCIRCCNRFLIWGRRRCDMWENFCF